MHNVAVIGNTKLTLLALEKCLTPLMKVEALFSLNEKDTTKKTNGIDLKDFCNKNNISFINNNDWDQFNSVCIKKGVTIVFVLGDSRIVPKSFLNNYPLIIGNHGAMLPSVKGGASLVWGRMINNGSWGVSLFKLGSGVDTGPILARQSFNYREISMEDFVNRADQLTVDLLEVLCLKIINNEPLEEIENSPWSVKVAKHTDSQQVCKIIKHCIKNKINIYLPPRTIEDSLINEDWNTEFQDEFKAANSLPYPMWKENV